MEGGRNRRREGAVEFDLRRVASQKAIRLLVERRFSVREGLKNTRGALSDHNKRREPGALRTHTELQGDKQGRKSPHDSGSLPPWSNFAKVSISGSFGIDELIHAVQKGILESEEFTDVRKLTLTKRGECSDVLRR